MPNRTWFIQLFAEAISEATDSSQELFGLGAECGVDREPQKEISDYEWKHPSSRDCQTIRDHVTRWGFAEPHRVFFVSARFVSGGTIHCRVRFQQLAAPPPFVAALFFRAKTAVYSRIALPASLPDCGPQCHEPSSAAHLRGRSARHR